EDDLPDEGPGRGDDGHECRHPVMETLRNLIALWLEEEHLLKVLLQAARAVDVALERGRRGGIGADVALLQARCDLVLERAGEAAVARESVTRAGQLVGERERTPAERVDRDCVPFAHRLGGAVEAGEALELIPRRMVRERVRWNLHLDVYRVAYLRVSLARK